MQINPERKAVANTSYTATSTKCNYTYTEYICGNIAIVRVQIDVTADSGASNIEEATLSNLKTSPAFQTVAPSTLSASASDLSPVVNCELTTDKKIRVRGRLAVGRNGYTEFIYPIA